MSVLILSKAFVWNFSHSKKKWNMIKMYIGLHVKYLLFLSDFNLLKPTGHVMRQQFNIQQLYVLPTLYLCVLYLSENKQRPVPLTA